MQKLFMRLGRDRFASHQHHGRLSVSLRRCSASEDGLFLMANAARAEGRLPYQSTQAQRGTLRASLRNSSKPRQESDLKRTVHDKWKAVTALLLSIALTACAVGPSASEGSERLTRAQAMFAQRCQAAGEKIYRTVDDVEGIFLLKLRPNYVNYGNQYSLDDPYGSDLLGDGYIESFLRGSYQAHVKDDSNAGLKRLGYSYVDAINPADGLRYRYTGSIREHEVVSSVLMGGTGKKFKTTGFVMDKVLAPEASPRYGVTYDDISTGEERKYWIAGSSLRVIDLVTSEVIAERIGYMMDIRQGSVEGGRSPWLLAANNACPSFYRDRNPVPAGRASAAQSRQAQDFVQKVLRPKIN